MTELESFALDVLREVGNRYPLSRPVNLKWKNLRVSAGLASPIKFEITLSRLILTTEGRVRETLLHEYAHLMAFDRYGRIAANHGPYWQAAMRELGLPPIVRHSYETYRTPPKQLNLYRCQRCGNEFERARRLNAKKRYLHRNCGGPIQFVGVRAVTVPAHTA